MGSLSGEQVNSSEAQVRRVAALRRGFQRQLGTKPTSIQKALRDRAATMTALAEACALDPHVSWDDKVRLDHAAQRARYEFAAAIARHSSPLPSLDALLGALE